MGTTRPHGNKTGPSKKPETSIITQAGVWGQALLALVGLTIIGRTSTAYIGTQPSKDYLRLGSFAAAGRHNTQGPWSPLRPDE